MATAAARSGLVLSESRALRLFSFFLFYLGQGLPLGVSQVALPAWLVMNGAPDSAVAAAIAYRRSFTTALALIPPQAKSFARTLY